jgi:hypothetical protein
MYKKKTNKRPLNNLLIFTFLQKMLQLASMFTNTTQLYVK